MKSPQIVPKNPLKVPKKSPKSAWKVPQKCLKSLQKVPTKSSESVKKYLKKSPKSSKQFFDLGNHGFSTEPEKTLSCSYIFSRSVQQNDGTKTQCQQLTHTGSPDWIKSNCDLETEFGSVKKYVIFRAKKHLLWNFFVRFFWFLERTKLVGMFSF